MRGRKPKPIARQIAEGDPRKHGKHKLEEKLAAEPKPTRGLPECPRHLKGRARKAWIFLADELARMELDCRPDALMLEGVCVNFERALLADQQLRRDGLTVEDKVIAKNGDVVVTKIRNHPAILISNQAWRIVRMFCTEFGITPVSRTRLALVTVAGDSNAEGDLMKILSQPRPKREVKPQVN